MSRKAKKDNAAKLEAAKNVPDETGAVADDAASTAGAGAENEAPASDAPNGNEITADAAPAGEMPGTADADKDASDAEKPEAEAEADDKLEHQHEPAAYEDFPEILTVGFEEAFFSVNLTEGYYFTVRFLDIDFLGLASPEAQRHIEIEPHRLTWRSLGAGLTVDRLLERACGGNMPSELLERAGFQAPQESDQQQAGKAPKNLIDINVLAAYAAASMAFGTTEQDETTLPRLDLGWLSAQGDHQKMATCAAAFARRTIAAPPETLVIHLRRSGFRETPEATGRVEAAWHIFLATLAELDRLDQAEANAAQLAEQAALAAQGPRGALRADLTMAPADPNPLTDLGRRLQRGG